MTIKELIKQLELKIKQGVEWISEVEIDGEVYEFVSVTRLELVKKAGN